MPADAYGLSVTATSRTIQLIEPLRPRIIEIGGSRAQRDVFHETLIEECFRAGDLERAERLLPRGDHVWIQRRAGAPEEERR